MAEEKKTQEQIAQELATKMSEQAEVTKTEQYLENNIIEFPYKEKTYRMRRPTIREKSIVNSSKILKMNELIKQGFSFQKQLIDQLKETQGIDVEAIDVKIARLANEIKKEQDRLAPEVNKQSREAIKQKIQELKNEQYLLIVQKADYLQPSIEAQLYEHTILQFASLLLEVKNEKNEWVKVFKNFDEFIDCTNETLVNVAIHYVNVLI
ncbi:MAG: hypothetical protein DRJ38_05430 [Thermoprotei archaeon]|nr:MAG: hypothetical protein DRJ38_05430 [Thermoprotei archaeon]